MKNQKMTKYEKRLIMTNIYHHVLIEYKKPESRYYGYDVIASDYIHKHLPFYRTHTLLDLTWDWMMMTFNGGIFHPLELHPLDVIDKCNQYGINLEDIKNLQGYIN